MARGLVLQRPRTEAKKKPEANRTPPIGGGVEIERHKRTRDGAAERQLAAAANEFVPANKRARGSERERPDGNLSVVGSGGESSPVFSAQSARPKIQIFPAM